MPAFLLPGKTINVLFETRDCGGKTRGKGGISKELGGQTYGKNLGFLETLCRLIKNSPHSHLPLTQN